MTKVSTNARVTHQGKILEPGTHELPEAAAQRLERLGVAERVAAKRKPAARKRGG